MAGGGGPADEKVLGGLAFDAVSGALFVSDTSNHRVRRVDRHAVITTFAGDGHRGFAGDGGPASAARLDFPFGLLVLGGELLIADRNNRRVRAVGELRSGAKRLGEREGRRAARAEGVGRSTEQGLRPAPHGLAPLRSSPSTPSPS